MTLLEAEPVSSLALPTSRLARGNSAPLGATPGPAGVNFSVYSRHSTGIELLLFDHVDDARAARVIPIDPADNRTYHYWHVFVPGLAAGQLYGYRAQGPGSPRTACASIPPRSCSTRTAAASRCPTATIASPPACPATTAGPR